MNFKIDYDFYKEFYKYKDFKEKLEIRINDIKTKYVNKSDNYDFIIKQYFVELFSWSVFSKSILDKLNIIFKNYGINKIIDPCCGNAFHNYLLNLYLNLDILTIDIQNEENSWTPIKEIDCRKYLNNLKIKDYDNSALLLSWIDYESLNIDLLNLYKGNMVISVGNYDNLSPNYLIEIKKKYNLIENYILEMPWGLTEKIEIYYRN